MTSLRECIRLIASLSNERRLSGGDLLVAGALVGLLSKAFLAREQSPEGEAASLSGLLPINDSGEPNLFQLGLESRVVADLVSRLEAGQSLPSADAILSAMLAPSKDPYPSGNGVTGSEGVAPLSGLPILSSLSDASQLDHERLGFSASDSLSSLSLAGRELFEQLAQDVNDFVGLGADSPADDDFVELLTDEHSSSAQADANAADEPTLLADLLGDESSEFLQTDSVADLAIAPDDDSLPYYPVSSVGSALGGGGGSGGGGSSAGGGGSSAAGGAASGFSGAVIDGYVEGATVFADLDGDYTLDWVDLNANAAWDSGEGEVWALTNASGVYTFSDASSIGAAKIVSLGGVDVTTLAAIDMLIAPSGYAYVTPVSTVYAYAGATAGGALLTSLGLSEADLRYDPAASTSDSAATMLQTGASLLTIVSNTASLLTELGGASTASAFEGAFSAVANLGATDFAGLLSSDSTTSSTALSGLITTTLKSGGVDASSYADLADLIANTTSSVSSVTTALKSLSASQIRAGEHLGLASTGQATLLADVKSAAALLASGDSTAAATVAALKTSYDTLGVANLKASAAAKLAFNTQDGSSLIASKADTVTLAAPVSGSVTQRFDVLANDTLTGAGALELAAVGLFTANVRKGEIPQGSLQAPVATATTLVLDSGASNVDDAYNRQRITLLTADGPIVADITDYVGDSRTATITVVSRNGTATTQGTDNGLTASEITALSSGQASYLISKALPSNITLGIENNQLVVTNVPTAPNAIEVGRLELIYVVQKAGDPSEAETNLVTVNFLPPTPTVAFASGATISVAEASDESAASLSGKAGLFTEVAIPLSVSGGLGLSGTLQLKGLPTGSFITYTIPDGTDADTDRDLVVVAKDVGSPFWTIGGTNALTADLTSIKAYIPSDLAREFTVSATATARYGGLSSRSTEVNTTLSITPTADGLTAQESSGTIMQGVVPDTTEDTAFAFAPASVSGGFDITAFVNSLTLNDTDGSERIGLRIEFAVPSSGWSYSFTNSAAKYREISGGLEVFDHAGLSLAEALKALLITPPANFAGTATFNVTPGSFEVASTNNGIPPAALNLLGSAYSVPVAVKAGAETISLIAGRSSSGLEGATSIPLPLASVIDPSTLESGLGALGDERLSIEVTLTRSVALMRNDVALVPAAITETTATYVIDVAQKTFSTDLAVYDLKPNANYASPLGGELITVKVTPYEPSNGAVGVARSETIHLTVTPTAADPGSPLAVRSEISIAESQPAIGSAAASLNWVAAADAIRMPISSDTLATGETLKVIVTASNNLVLATKTVDGSTVTHTTLTPTSSDASTTTYSLTPAQYAQLELRGSYFSSGSGTLTATLRSEEVWGGSFEDGDPITATIVLSPVASGVKSEPTLQAVPITEDPAAGIQLSALVATQAVLNDTSESLLYKVFVPTTAKLLAVAGGNLGLIAAASSVTVGSDTVSGLSYTLTEDQLAAYEVRPIANFSGSLTLQFQAIGQESNGASKAGIAQTVSLVVDPVSDTPILVAPSAVTGLVSVPSTTLISVPLQLVRTDSTGTPETLTARIKIDGISSVSDVQFYLGTKSVANALTVTGDSTTGFFIDLNSDEVAKLSTLAVTSAKDYRGDGKLTLTVTGISQDGLAPIASTSTTVDLTLYQTIAPPIFSLEDGPLAVQTKAAIGFSVALPSNAPTGLTLEDISVLVTGAPAQAYFVVKSGTGDTATYTTVGSSLGEGGVWLFSAKDLYNFAHGVPTTPKKLFIINAGADITSTLSAQAFVSDTVGGTGNQSDRAESLTVTFNTTEPVGYVDHTDPLILSLDGSALSSSDASGLEFDLDTYFAGKERPTYWVSGDAANKTGFAFVVQPRASAGQVDSIVDLYDDFAAFAQLDANSDGVVTGDELTGVQLWFDEDKDAVADAGELVDLPTVLPGFAGDLQTISTARAASAGQIIPLYEASASWNGVSDASLFAVAVPYQNAVLPVASSTTTTPFSSAPTAAVIMVGQPTATATVQVPEDLPGGIPFRIDLAQAVTTAGNPTHLIKVYGVPSTASLSLGAKVILDTAKPNEFFWLLTADQIAGNVSIVDLPEHYTGTISLTAQAVASVLTGTGANVSVSTVSGALSSAAVAVVTGVADTPLLSANTDAITIHEGGDLYLTADGQVWANALDDIAAISSPEAAEALYVRFRLDADDFVVTGASNLGTTGLGANTYEVRYDNAKNVVIKFDPLFSDDVVLTIQGVSEQGSNESFSSNTSAISVGFTPVADGVRDFTSQARSPIVYEGGTPALNTAPTLTLSATPVDGKEAVRFEVLIGGGADVAEAITSVSGAIEQTLSTAEASAWGISDIEDLVNWKLFSVDATKAASGSYTYTASDLDGGGLRIELDAYFDGSITHKSRAISIDPTSGVESIPLVEDLEIGTITVSPKVVSDAYSIEIFKLIEGPAGVFVRDGLASGVELKEGGLSGWFEVNAKAFDPDETIALASSFSLPPGFSALVHSSNANLFRIEHDGTASTASSLTFSPKVTLTDGSASLTETVSKVALSISLDINDAPTVVGVPRVSGSIVEGATLTGAGSISFADLDLTDRPAATEVTKSVAALKADGTTPLTLDATQLAAIENAFRITPAAGNTNNGSINWSYSIGGGSVDFLAAGERVNAVFTVTISDGQGGTATQDVTVSITGTNDAPTITSVAGTTDLAGAVTEDGSASTLTDTGTITFDDVDLTNAHTVSAVKASGTLGGNLALGGVSESATTTAGSVPWTYSVANSATQYLAAGQTASEVFTVTISDGQGGTVTQNVAITITGTNDAPIFTSSSSGTVAENAATTTVVYTASATDVDVSDTRTYSLKPATGDVSLLNINATIGAVTLNAPADFETRPSYSFTVVASDTANTRTEQAVTVAVTNVNEAPVFTTTNLGVTYTDTAATDTFANTTSTFSATDDDVGTTLSYGISGGSGTTTITKAGTYGTFSINSASGAYTYTPNHSAINTLTTSESDIFTISVSDGSLSATTNYTVNLVGSNDLPMNIIATASTLEDTAKSIQGIQIADTDSTNVTVTFTHSAGALSVATNVANGLTASAISGSGTATLILTGTVAQINATLAASSGLLYTPTANFNGSATLTMTTDDGAGGIDSDTVAMTVSAVNDAPTGKGSTLTILEDGSKTFTETDFGFSDAVENHTLLAVIITTLPTAGTLTLSGEPVSANQSIALENLGNLVYTPAANANGNSYATIGFKVQDTGGTANGGVDTSLNANTLTVDVTAVNDAPTIITTDVTGVITEASVTIISGISVTDIDSNIITLTLSTNAGRFGVSNAGGNSLTLTGSADQINATLAAGRGLIFNATKPTDTESYIRIEASDDAGASTTNEISLKWYSELIINDETNAESVIERLLNPNVETIRLKVDSAPGSPELAFTESEWEDVENFFSKIYNPEAVILAITDVSGATALSVAGDDRVQVVELTEDSSANVDADNWSDLLEDARTSSEPLLGKLRTPSGALTTTPTLRLVGVTEQNFSPLHTTLLSGLNFSAIVWAISLSEWEKVYEDYNNITLSPGVSISLTEWEWNGSDLLPNFNAVETIEALAGQLINFGSLDAWLSFRDNLLQKLINPETLTLNVALPLDFNEGLELTELEALLLASGTLKFGELDVTALGDLKVSVHGVSADHAIYFSNLSFVDNIELDPSQAIFLSQSDWSTLFKSGKLLHSAIGNNAEIAPTSTTFIDPNLRLVISSEFDLRNPNFGDPPDTYTSVIKGPATGDNIFVAQSNIAEMGSALFAGEGNDLMIGGLGHDYLFGDEGDDIFVPLGQADVIVGGSGADIVEISADAHYEEIERTEMASLIAGVLLADTRSENLAQGDIEKFVSDFETHARSTLDPGISNDLQVVHRFVGIQSDYNQSEGDSVLRSGFETVDEFAVGDLRMAFATSFAEVGTGGAPATQVTFTSMMLIDDSTDWSLEDMQVPQI